MRHVEFEFPDIVLHKGDTLSFTYVDDGEDISLLHYEVDPDPVRAAALLADLEQELEAL